MNWKPTGRRSRCPEAKAGVPSPQRAHCASARDHEAPPRPVLTHVCERRLRLLREGDAVAYVAVALYKHVTVHRTATTAAAEQYFCFSVHPSVPPTLSPGVPVSVCLCVGVLPASQT